MADRKLSGALKRRTKAGNSSKGHITKDLLPPSRPHFPQTHHNPIIYSNFKSINELNYPESKSPMI
jgi:hypothetical protein